MSNNVPPLDYEETIPQHWGELSEAQRAEIVAMADSRILSKKLWSGFYRKVERLKGLGTLVLTIAALFALFGDALAEGVNSWLDSKK